MKKSIFIFLCIFLCGCLFSCTLITHFDSDKSSGSEYFDPSNFNPTADIFSPGLYYGRSLLSTQEEQKGYDLIMRTLVGNGIALVLQLVLMGQSRIKGGNEVLGGLS